MARIVYRNCQVSKLRKSCIWMSLICHWRMKTDECSQRSNLWETSLTIDSCQFLEDQHMKQINVVTWVVVLNKRFKVHRRIVVQKNTSRTASSTCYLREFWIAILSIFIPAEKLWRGSTTHPVDSSPFKTILGDAVDGGDEGQLRLLWRRIIAVHARTSLRDV